MSAANDKLVQASIITRFTEDNPRAGLEFEEWVENVAKDLSVTESKVRSHVQDYTEGYLNAIGKYAQTQAQRIAEIRGATLSLAFGKLYEGLNATKKRAVVIGKGEDARVEYYEVPDWPSINTNIKTVIAVYGAEAPKQIEVHSRNENINITDVELLKQLQELTGQIAAHAKNSTGGHPAQVAEGPGPQPRVEGASGDPRPLLLVDGVYQDGGQPERGAIQAVPEGKVHRKPRGRAAKREGSPG